MRKRASCTRANPRTLTRAMLMAGLYALIVGPVRADDPAPGIAAVPPDTAVTEAFQYPQEMRADGHDGVYREVVAYPSTSFPAGRVAFWESKAGTLRSLGYPIDEFVYVIAGELETVDADGTVKHFGPGSTFVIPKGWIGEWRMKTDFKKVFVNF